MLSLKSAIGVFAFLAAFITTTLAATPPSSVLVYNTNGAGINFTLAINVPSGNSSDLFFHMSAPNQQSWIAFGLGESMSDSPLMFVAYRSADGKNVTVSPRLATGHSEPQHNPVKDVTVTVLAGTKIEDGEFGSMVVNAKCENCRKWSGSQVDVTSTNQPFIMAVFAGADSGVQNMQSDDLNAQIRIHTGYYQFSLNMRQATGIGGVPIAPFNQSSTVNHSENTANDSHLGRAFHGLLMLGSFTLLFPLGIVWLRVLEKVWMHWLNQAFATVIIVIAAIIGIVISINQKLTPSLNSSHQLFGLVAVALVLIQLLLGAIHHSIYIRTQRPSPLGKIHRYFGPVVVLTGLVNGFLGFSFADNNRYQIVYGMLILIVGLSLGGLLLMKNRRQRKKEALGTAAPGNFNAAHQTNGGAMDIPLRDQAQPPAYGVQEAYGQGPGTWDGRIRGPPGGGRF